MPHSALCPHEPHIVRSSSWQQNSHDAIKHTRVIKYRTARVRAGRSSRVGSPCFVSSRSSPSSCLVGPLVPRPRSSSSPAPAAAASRRRRHERQHEPAARWLEHRDGPDGRWSHESGAERSPGALRADEPHPQPDRDRLGPHLQPREPNEGAYTLQERTEIGETCTCSSSRWPAARFAAHLQADGFDLPHPRAGRTSNSSTLRLDAV